MVLILRIDRSQKCSWRIELNTIYSMDFTCVLSVDEKNGLGYQNLLPWSKSMAGRDDLKDFRRYTTKTPNTAVIMGRKTRDSIPNFPLKHRINIVLTRQIQMITVDDMADYGPQTCVVYAPSLDSALTWCKDHASKVMVIGGWEVFKEAFQSPYCKKIRITRIPDIYTCDTYLDMKRVSDAFALAYEYTRDTGCTVFMYKRKV